MASSSFPTAAAPSPTPSTAKPFRFKREHITRSTGLDPSERRSLSPSKSDRPRRHRHRHHHHHRSRRRPQTPPPKEWDRNLDPDTAFRESLFDALADDEGADFWEGVYGQPIHNYSPYYPASNNAGNEPEDGEHPRLERMTDEEYVAFVRAKMWEKSHGYIVEERKRREEERGKRREKEKREREWDRGVEEALRRGEERKRRGRWKGVWESYVDAWEGNIVESEKGIKKGKTGIRWPVESGKWKDVEKEAVERFYKHAPQADGDGMGSLLELLKKERIKWHPDKMQQRAGSEGLNAETTKLVTAVFQVIDRLWNEVKEAP